MNIKNIKYFDMLLNSWRREIHWRRREIHWRRRGGVVGVAAAIPGVAAAIPGVATNKLKKFINNLNYLKIL